MQDERELEIRAKAFAVALIGQVDKLPDTAESRVIRLQILQVGTSIGGHVRAGNRVRAERAKRYGQAEAAADETAYWIELAMEARLSASGALPRLLTEASDLAKMCGAQRKEAEDSRPPFRADRGERPDRGDRGDRGGYDRGDRGRSDRGDRGGYDRGRNERGGRGGYDRGDRGRNDRGDRGGYGRNDSRGSYGRDRGSRPGPGRGPGGPGSDRRRRDEDGD